MSEKLDNELAKIVFESGYANVTGCTWDEATDEERTEAQGFVAELDVGAIREAVLGEARNSVTSQDTIDRAKREASKALDDTLPRHPENAGANAAIAVLRVALESLSPRRALDAEPERCPTCGCVVNPYCSDPFHRWPEPEQPPAYSVCSHCGLRDDPRRTTCLSCGGQMRVVDAPEPEQRST